MKKQFFLYRLFIHSKTGFLFISIFICCYAVFFYKKMDTVFTPYNSMFAIDFNKNYSSSVYAIKLEGKPLGITNHLYWKKDFLEQSLTNYCKYLLHNNTSFMNEYLRLKITDPEQRQFLMNRLVADKQATDNFLSWYLGFAGVVIPPAGSAVELMQYSYSFEGNAAVITDSVSILKKRIF